MGDKRARCRAVRLWVLDVFADLKLIVDLIRSGVSSFRLHKSEKSREQATPARRENDLITFAYRDGY